MLEHYRKENFFRLNVTLITFKHPTEYLTTMFRSLSVVLALFATILAAFAETNVINPKSNLRLATNAPLIPLGECSEFAVMAGTSASFNGQLTTIYSGDVGVSPGTSLTGNYKLNSGSVEVTSTKSNQCASDRITAYNAAQAAVCPPSNILNELSGRTLFPGVYCAVTAPMTFSAGTLTLDAQGDTSAVWVFQASSSLVTAPYTSFILENGAQSTNIFWQISSSATLGYSSSFVGTIIAYSSVSVQTDVALNGRALAGAGTSFAGDDSVTLPAIITY